MKILLILIFSLSLCVTNAQSQGEKYISTVPKKNTLSVSDNIFGVDVNGNAVQYPMSIFNVFGDYVIKVDDFGAKGDGITDDTQAIQNAFNALSSIGGSIYFGGKTYLISTIDIPKISYGTIYIFGYGTIIKSVTNANLFQRVPVDQTEALNVLTASKIIIEGVKFSGNGGSLQKGVVIGGSYGTVLKSCTFSALENGAELRFCLMSTVENCDFLTCNTIGLYMGVGDWSGASVYNSQSNGSLINQCRFVNKAGAHSSIYVSESSDIRINGVIFEGGNPQHGLYIRSNATVIKGFELDGLHNECTESVAIIKLVVPVYAGGIYKFSYIYNQMSTVNIDASECVNALIVVDRLLYAIGTPLFKKGTSTAWTFRDCQITPSTSSYWENGSLPTTLKVY